MKNPRLSEVWQQHVIPTHISHVLVLDAEGDGIELAELALQVAAPSGAEVTLCCSNQRHSGKTGSIPHAAAASLREKGLTVSMEPIVLSALQTILLVDGIRSIDLIIMRDYASSTTAASDTASAIQIGRRMQRPVIACGPSFTQNRITGTLQGPILAATSMRESARQIAYAAARLEKVIKTPLIVLHAVDIEHELSRPDNLTGVDYACRMLANAISSYGVTATAKIACGPIAEEVTRFADRANACLIVMGLDLAEEGHEAERSDRLRRNILHDAPCPVLFVPTFHSAGQRDIDVAGEVPVRGEESAHILIK